MNLAELHGSPDIDQIDSFGTLQQLLQFGRSRPLSQS